jgi:hypothetical protein
VGLACNRGLGRQQSLPVEVGGGVPSQRPGLEDLVRSVSRHDAVIATDLRELVEASSSTAGARLLVVPTGERGGGCVVNVLAGRAVVDPQVRRAPGLWFDVRAGTSDRAEIECARDPHHPNSDATFSAPLDHIDHFLAARYNQGNYKQIVAVTAVLCDAVLSEATAPQFDAGDDLMPLSEGGDRDERRHRVDWAVTLAPMDGFPRAHRSAAAVERLRSTDVVVLVWQADGSTSGAPARTDVDDLLALARAPILPVLALEGPTSGVPVEETMESVRAVCRRVGAELIDERRWLRLDRDTPLEPLAFREQLWSAVAACTGAASRSIAVLHRQAAAKIERRAWELGLASAALDRASERASSESRPEQEQTVTPQADTGGIDPASVLGSGAGSSGLDLHDIARGLLMQRTREFHHGFEASRARARLDLHDVLDEAVEVVLDDADDVRSRGLQQEIHDLIRSVVGGQVESWAARTHEDCERVLADARGDCLALFVSAQQSWIEDVVSSRRGRGQPDHRPQVATAPSVRRAQAPSARGESVPGWFDAAVPSRTTTVVSWPVHASPWTERTVERVLRATASAEARSLLSRWWRQAARRSADRELHRAGEDLLYQFHHEVHLMTSDIASLVSLLLESRHRILHELGAVLPSGHEVRIRAEQVTVSSVPAGASDAASSSATQLRLRSAELERIARSLRGDRQASTSRDGR